jgi:acetyl esterase
VGKSGEDGSLRDRVRQRVGAFAVDNMFRVAARVGRLHPRARPHKHGVEVLRDLRYAAGTRREHRLDVYRPRGVVGAAANGGPRLPAVLYVHGGGFRILSKDTHWMMGLAFARAGYVVFNISYRLAPRHPFPAALEDCAAAYRWVAEHASAYRGDVGRLVLAGESAGANLVSALTLMACFERPEQFARAVFETGVTPRAWLPYCGMLQVSDAARFGRRKPALSPWVNDRLLEVERCYLGAGATAHGAAIDLADPLCALERGDRPARPLPPCFVAVGTRDPLLDDTRRLEAALRRAGAPVEARYYPGEVHAFHALVWRAQARRCWGHSFRFLDRALDGGA